MSDFPDGCCLVIGASGGLGRAITYRLAELGANLVVTYRSHPEPLYALAKELELAGTDLHVVSCDITDLATVSAAFSKAIDAQGRIHSVVNVTGLPYAFGLLAEQDSELFGKVLDVDVKGFFNIARSAVPHMRENGGGSIVTIGTAGVGKTIPGNALSSVPKSAVAMMVRLLAAEEGIHGIRVNFVGAGIFSAGMALSMNEAGTGGGEDFEEFAKEISALKRSGNAAECADFVAYLISNRASYVTGQIVYVDGGITA